MPSRLGLSNMGSDAALGQPGFLRTRVDPSSETGVQLSESSLLHVGLSAEAGYDSNVFFLKTNPISSPTLRIIPFIEITNAGRGGAIPTGVYYDLTASLLYREFLSEDPNVKAQRAFNPAIGGRLEFGSGRSVTAGISEFFTRVEDPPYGPGRGNITHTNNLASAELRWAPGGGRLAGTLRYSNVLDLFEGEYKYANSLGHDVTLDASWKWLPKTALYLQFSQGYIDFISPSTLPGQQKYSSLPLRALVGLRGLVTEKLSLQLGVGYTNAFYREGPNPSGWGNLAGLAELTLLPTILTNIVLGYRHEFRNSVIGNFYNVDALYLILRQALASRFVTSAFVRYENRRYSDATYQGMVVDRDDNFIQGGATADFFVKSWFYAGVSYSLAFNRSSLADLAGIDPTGLDYEKHLILGRLGVTY